MARILPEDMDYTARDFDSLDTRLQRATDSVFPGWTDKEKSNFGNIIREMLAYVGDVYAYYQDAQAVESRFTTCTRRENGIKHARALNYTLARQTASTVDVTVTLRDVAVGKVTIDAGSIIRTPSAVNPVRVQALSSREIAAGVLSIDVPCENSLTWETGFLSDDAADQEFILPQIPFLEVVSMVDDVGSFIEVENFHESGPGDPHYFILISDADRALVRYGDGNQGRKPSGQVTIFFQTGGGSVDIEPNTLIVPEFALEDEFGNPAPFDTTNSLSATVGSARESLVEAQRKAPAQVTVNERSVTWSDFRANAESVEGVARAIIITSDQLVGIDENYGQLYVVGKGTVLSTGAIESATPSQTVLDDVKIYIDTERESTITFQYDVISAQFKSVDITARIRLVQGANPTAVDAAIRLSLAEYFAVIDSDGNVNTDINFGFEYKDELGNPNPRIYWSDLFGAILQTDGVRSVHEDSFIPENDVILELNQFPQLGTVILINDRTGQPLV